MRNERNCSIFIYFVRLSCFRSSLRIFLVLFLHLFAFVGNVTTTPDIFQFQSQVSLSEIERIVPIRLKFKLYAIFIEWCSRINVLFMGPQDKRQLLGLSLPDFQELLWKVGTKNCSTWSRKNVCKNVSSQPNCLFCSFCKLILLSFFLTTTCHEFSHSLSIHTLCSCLEILSTTNKLSNFWRRVFQQFSTYAFWSWSDIVTQKCICVSPNNLCKCTESPSTFLIKTFREWTLACLKATIV